MKDDRGFYPKYRAFKIEGVNEIMPGVPIRVAGIPVEEVTSPFFLMKFDDPYARPAIRLYSEVCEEDLALLSADLRRKLRNTKVKDGS